MKISVITVTYNSAATIVDTLKSVAEQTYPDIEHIIVDGASSDDTVRLVERYGERVAKMVSQPDKGIYDAMNRGICLATGDVLGFLNSDDVFAHDSALREYASALKDTRIDACYGDLVYVSSTDLNKVIRYWKSGPYAVGAYAKAWTPPHPTFYARRSVYEAYGDFNLDMPLAADFEVMCRLIHTIGIQTKYLPGIKVKMRVGGATNASVRNIVKSNIEIMRAMRLHGIPVGLRYFFGKAQMRFAQFARRMTYRALVR